MSEWLRKTFRAAVAPIMLLRTRRMAAFLGAHVREGESVLDVGCGTMTIGREITRTKKVRWVGIDTLDYHTADLEFHRHSGGKLPFEDGSFDIVLLSFVLHHCEDPLVVLDDCIRVSKDKLLILEETLRGGRMDLAVAKLHDYAANRLLEPDIPLPYNFKTAKAWRAIFTSRGLKITAELRVQSQPLTLTRQTLFVLQKT